MTRRWCDSSTVSSVVLDSKMVRVPKFFVTLSSTNLTPDRPVKFRIHASTHHWRGELTDTYAVAELEYDNPYQTENAFTVFKEMFLAIQETTEPSKDILLEFTGERSGPVLLSEEEKLYYDAVQLVTSKGWRWSENFNENILTGERKTMGGTKPFHLSLSTWEWGGKALGSSVGFSHFQQEGESRAELLLRILETAEKAKHDFPDSIPYTNIYGIIEKDEFKTRIVFGQ
jgi:hypothetical protein